MQASTMTVFTVTLCAFIALGGFHAANASQRFEALPDGVVTFADATGSAVARPLIDIRGAYPGMPEQQHALGVVNTGDVPAAWELDVHTHTSGPVASLVDVLIVTVRSADGGAPLYHGPLGALELSGAALGPAAVARFEIEVGWPDGGAADNAFQGAALNFDLMLRSRAA